MANSLNGWIQYIQVNVKQVNVKLIGIQLKKLKTAVKNKTETTLKMSFKMLDGNDLPHELLLTTR